MLLDQAVKKPETAPHGPTRWEVATQVPWMIGDYLTVIRRCVDRYGDVVRLPFKWPTFFLNDPEDIRHILVINHRNYVKARGMKFSKKFLGDGLLTSEVPK